MRSFFISVPGCIDNSISITYSLQLIYGPFIHVVPLPDLMQLQTNVSVVGTTSSPQILLCYEVNWLMYSKKLGAVNATVFVCYNSICYHVDYNDACCASKNKE